MIAFPGLPAAIFALCLSLPAAAQERGAGERGCTGPTFADMPSLRFGRAPPGASVTFGKAPLVRGELLALGAPVNGQVCAEKVKGKGAQTGWIALDSIDRVPRINDTGSFVGTWRHNGAEIRIVWLEEGRITVEGLTQGGAFSGDMDMRDGIGFYWGEGVDPENPESPGCRVRMALGFEVMIVRDNGQCRANFGGTYLRDKPPATAPAPSSIQAQ